jgi:hypothetical protein
LDQIIGALLGYGVSGVIAAIGLTVGALQYRRNNQLVDALIKLSESYGTNSAASAAAMNRLADMLDVRGDRGRG